ncbi:MAG: GNAT family N-acetyltransferase [Candidatus Methanomethylophilaceae archaeon]|jgi:aminoglycoside 6'-N-acetyltransferase I|nr:GNAT family N-acetyltransferase [Candidatus Methanomethylophilaceae archaeon]
MEIRQMKLKDLVKVRDLEISCIKEYFSVILENRWEDLPADWRENLGASSRKSFMAYIESGLSFVAAEDDEIVGFIFAQMLHHVYDTENLVWIENMGVHPYFRRNAIGYKLLRELARAAKDKGATVIHSAIQPDNVPSILLHKKIGFFMDRREVALMDLTDPKLKL